MRRLILSTPHSITLIHFHRSLPTCFVSVYLTFDSRLLHVGFVCLPGLLPQTLRLSALLSAHHEASRFAPSPSSGLGYPAPLLSSLRAFCPGSPTSPAPSSQATPPQIYSSMTLRKYLLAFKHDLFQILRALQLHQSSGVLTLMNLVFISTLRNIVL